MLWPILVYLGVVLVVVAGMLLLSFVLGQRHSDHATVEPYESGIVSTGVARLRFDARFYLVAMFFVIFDLEAMFVFAWAISLREAGWQGYADGVVFVGVLTVALAYLWRVGALDWTNGSRRRSRREDERSWT